MLGPAELSRSVKTRHMMLAQIPVLDPVGCERASEEVCCLSSQWIPRMRPPASFFTLGVASYQDLSSPAPGVAAHDYYQEAPIYNAIILNRLSWLLERVRSTLECWLGAPAHFSESLAVPGFHIFEEPAIPRADVASIHCDLQYQLINWNDGAPSPDFDHPISFTLPIKLPLCGGGLNSWALSYEEIPALLRQHGASNVGEVIQHRSKTFHPYTEGIMVVHSGHQVHQIGPSPGVQPEDKRITLQGHGLCRNSEWVLYW
jgi:hypothetical protein